MKSYQELTVWQKSFAVAKKTYQVTKQFPREEMYGLTSQMRRAAVSIPSNIAEGCTRGSTKEYIQFLNVALGSASELETQLLLAKELNYVHDQDFDELRLLLLEVLKMLNSLLTSLRIKANH